jgi:glycosyltransferase involved in cell wall biosynthesis
MKIAFYLNEPYPNGMACTKRVHLYAKGLIALGNNVKIIIPRATENSKFVENKTIKGKYEGVNYEYASNSTIRSYSFFKRRIQDIFAFFKSLKLIIGFKPDIVLFVGNSFFHILGLYVLKKIYKWKLLREKSEVPFSHKPFLSDVDKFTLIFIYNLFDGLIVISESLKGFFQQELNINCRYHITPILVEEIDDGVESNISNNIVYTGSLLERKDGIISLIKAFSKITKQFPELRLVMTGNLNKTNDRERILCSIREEGIESKIEFTGYISEKELKVLTSSARVLILAKPKNRQNKYNSATKVGEYLLTGQPVILSKEDTAREFLIDGIDVFMVDPSVDQLAKKLSYVLTYYNEALKVGNQGRETAIRKFNFLCQTKNINVFLNSIK